MNLNDLFYGWYTVVFGSEIVAILPTYIEADIYRDSFYPNGGVYPFDEAIEIYSRERI